MSRHGSPGVRAYTDAVASFRMNEQSDVSAGQRGPHEWEGAGQLEGAAGIFTVNTPAALASNCSATGAQPGCSFPP